MALTQECVLSFLLERGGRAKNSELLSNFRSHINCGDPAEKQHNRELFKRLVNSVAVVRQIGDVKFVVVKKRYQDFARDAAVPAAHDESSSSADASFSCASPQRADSAKLLYTDVENNNVCFPAHTNANCCCDANRAGGLPEDLAGAETTVKVLNLCGEQVSRAGRSGAVFAVVAVKSPPRGNVQNEGRIQSPRKANTSSSAPPVQPSLDTQLPSFKKDAKICWKTEEARTQSCPQARPQNKSTRQGEEAKLSESVPLEPLAHEWLVKCAAGLWGQIHTLLLQDPRLAQKRDFTSGFTALHWAAKEGNTHMIQELLEVPRTRGAHINVNAKAHGGYTPLHIAAIHGRSEAAVLLARGHGANVNERDNDGKKASHYLGMGASAEARALLGGLQPRGTERPDEDEYRENPKGFNTISKLFQPHIGKKQKHATKFAHDW